MTVVGAEWTTYAARLVNTLIDSGDLHDPAWAAAIGATPRHLLVPTAYAQQSDGSWAPITSRDHPDMVYSATTLVTQVDADGSAMSSSTKPDLMVRMLEMLDIRDEHNVLEIGTGTGYNVALLCHRLGDQHVFSIDVEPDTVAAARRRLANLGYRPCLAVADGREGWADHAPYDRIVATCSVARIPWAWAEQLSLGGLLLADLKLGTGAGNLVLLHREDDRLEGRFSARWAAFMGMRHAGETNPSRAPKAQAGRHRVTTAPPQPWVDNREVWLLANFTLPDHLRHGYTLDPATRTPSAATLSAADGSWCEVDLTLTDGSRMIREGGPTQLWAHVEHAYQRWAEWGQPNWERFGLTVTTTAMAMWLDDPHNAIYRVELP